MIHLKRYAGFFSAKTDVASDEVFTELVPSRSRTNQNVPMRFMLQAIDLLVESLSQIFFGRLVALYFASC